MHLVLILHCRAVLTRQGILSGHLVRVMIFLHHLACHLDLAGVREAATRIDKTNHAHHKERVSYPSKSSRKAHHSNGPVA
nr:hypothetical protein [uncultured Cohaesibacter sp.]